MNEVQINPAPPKTNLTMEDAYAYLGALYEIAGEVYMLALRNILRIMRGKSPDRRDPFIKNPDYFHNPIRGGIS